jgi:hypothetical protein
MSDIQITADAEFNVQLAARCLAYYAVHGVGKVWAEKRNHNPYQAWKLLGGRMLADKIQPVPCKLRKRVAVVVVNLCPEDWIHEVHCYGMQSHLVLEAFPLHLQERIVNILESHYDLGHNRR